MKNSTNLRLVTRICELYSIMRIVAVRFQIDAPFGVGTARRHPCSQLRKRGLCASRTVRLVPGAVRERRVGSLRMTRFWDHVGCRHTSRAMAPWTLVPEVAWAGFAAPRPNYREPRHPRPAILADFKNQQDLKRNWSLCLLNRECSFPPTLGPHRSIQFRQRTGWLAAAVRRGGTL